MSERVESLQLSETRCENRLSRLLFLCFRFRPRPGGPGLEGIAGSSWPRFELQGRLGLYGKNRQSAPDHIHEDSIVPF